MPPARKKDYATAFGDALDAQLAKRGVRQVDLARATGVSAAYINRLTKGSASPEWVDLIADTLKMPLHDRVELHKAAARAKGYKISE